MLKSDTQLIQSELGKFARDGKTSISGEVRKERLHHYRRLVRNIADGSLTSAYPILHKILSDEEWNNLVDSFMVRHSASDPQVWKYPKELIDFFENTNYQLDVLNKEFLIDLVKFEWMEMEVHGMEDEDHKQNSLRDPNGKTIFFNPHYKIEHFQYPVHKKNYKDIEKEKGNYFVMCYRKNSDLQVRYLSLSPLDIIVIQLLEQKLLFDDIYKKLIEMTGEKQDKIKNYVKIMLENLKEKEILI